MLLAVDIGNTNTVIGLFKNRELRRFWRISTRKKATVDEFSILVKSLFTESSLTPDDIKKVVISSVVPEIDHIISEFTSSYLTNAETYWINSESVRDIMPVLYTNPAEVGADRIINGIAAYKKHKSSLIVIDFGTATTFDVISSKGEYIGGAISPGIKISSEALFSTASKLPRAELSAPPETVVGKDTITSIKSGILYGYASMVDGMVSKIKKERKDNPRVIATGGLSVIMEKITESIDNLEPHLTLEGMLIVSELF
ncbi:MAG: pantothenate kinase [Deltaproteobacteria bacterium]|nr:MAG: pantothenate kinase [Deltaproteobacteria bacterium]